MLIVTGLALLEVFTNFRLFSRAFGSFAAYTIFGILLVEALSIIGIFRWKRWGVYGLSATMLLSFCVRSFLGILNPQTALAPIVAFFILYIFAGPHWKHYD
jgi:hypothetical protein